MANLWVGGELMKNGLHFDNFDNLLHQIRGRKRALLFPPHDTEHLYYGAASIRRHEFRLPEGVLNSTHFEKIRHNVAKINVFAEDVGTTHPKVHQASPTVCELEYDPYLLSAAMAPPKTARKPRGGPSKRRHTKKGSGDLTGELL